MAVVEAPCAAPVGAGARLCLRSAQERSAVLSLHLDAQSRQLSTAFYVTVASHLIFLCEGLKFTRKAKFFIFSGKIDKCCTEHLLFEDLRGKIDTRQFPSSGRYSWRTRDKTIFCKERGKKTVRGKNANIGYSPVRHRRQRAETEERSDAFHAGASITFHKPCRPPACAPVPGWI